MSPNRDNHKNSVKIEFLGSWIRRLAGSTESWALGIWREITWLWDPSTGERTAVDRNFQISGYIPVSIRVSMQEAPFWGRLTAISQDRIELVSQFEFRKDSMLVLEFELGGGKEDLRGSVDEAAKDACGYFQYTLKLPDQNQRKYILETLIRLRQHTHPLTLKNKLGN
jgi:hypothetical protein